MSDHPKRDRASSDRSNHPRPSRPPLQNRTTSAPVGVPRLNSRLPLEKTAQMVIEEEGQSPNPANPSQGERLARAHAMKGSDETLSKRRYPYITVGVVGGDGVGKTTFITSALDLSSPPSLPSTTKKMSLDGSVYLVCLLEIPTKEIAVEDDRIGWPRFGDGSAPAIDGVLVLHDPLQPATFTRTVRLLDSLSTSHIPFVVAASQPGPDPERDPVMANYQVLRAPSESSRSQKTCISAVLRLAIRSKNGSYSQDDSNQPGELSRGGDSTNSMNSPVHGHVRANSENPTALFSGPISDPPVSNGNRPTNFHTSSFLNMDDDKEDVQLDSQEKQAGSYNGATLDELVDRLVSKPNPDPDSKSDSKFRSIFLCLYRKFAPPASLLNSLISHFERNERTATDQLELNFDQSRVFNVLAQWVRDYPGDLAHPRTRKRLTDFVTMLEKSPFYMFFATEISAAFALIEEDEDESWPYGDGGAEEPNGSTETFLNNSGRSSPSLLLSGTTAEASGDDEEEDPIYSMSALNVSEKTEAPADHPATILDQEYIPLNLKAARKEAQDLDLNPRILLTKFQWRQFMEYPDEEIAEELTRADWILYRSFRSRDLVQHVCISGPSKEKIKNMQHVNRMIKRFNHLSTFVTSMILLRDKPKHRARALEKFMGIAQNLRRLYNYNSLGAVMSGIKGTPVARLSQTWELIPSLTLRKFLSLDRLMGSRPSHSTYRLAWGNSTTARIPFLPMHRGDLVSAEEGNRTFVDKEKTRINWKKFEVMGEIVVTLQLSQQSPYGELHQLDDVERLILEMKLPTDDEELYKRSMEVESSDGRKKFAFFRS